MDQPIVRRRRGAALEGAILDAAWRELAHGGYARLTFEGVAKLAGTSKPVLYRRWDSRARLAAAAIARHTRLNPLIVPDLGNLRDELCLLLRKFADRAPPKQMRLMFEMGQDLESERFGFSDSIFGKDDSLAGILARAVARGEIDAGQLSPRIMRLPSSLVLFEIIVTLDTLTDTAIVEIVDDIFLPLIAGQGRCRDVDAAP
jgi:AcrR family transcriptional regulator